MMTRASRDSFIAAMRVYPAAVTIIATGHAPQRAGLTATAVCSLSADPPRLLACVNATSGTAAAVLRNRVFSVNLLAPSQEVLAGRFASPGITGDARFEGDLWHQEGEAPLLRGATAGFLCRLAEHHLAGSHRVLIGDCLEVSHLSDPALVYRDGAFSAVGAAIP